MTGAPAAGTTVKISDETAGVPFKTVTVSDPDDGRTVTATVTVSNTSYGTLASTAGGSTNATFGIWTVSGTATAVTAALDALTFTPKAHQYAPGTVKSVSLSLGISDSAGTSSSASTTVAITSATDPDHADGPGGVRLHHRHRGDQGRSPRSRSPSPITARP